MQQSPPTKPQSELTPKQKELLQWLYELDLYKPGITPDQQISLLKTYIEDFKIGKDKKLFSNMFHYPPSSFDSFKKEFKKILKWPKEALLKYFNDEIAERKSIPAKINTQVRTLYDVELGKRILEERRRNNKLEDLPY